MNCDIFSLEKKLNLTMYYKPNSFFLSCIQSNQPLIWVLMGYLTPLPMVLKWMILWLDTFPNLNSFIYVTFFPFPWESYDIETSTREVSFRMMTILVSPSCLCQYEIILVTKVFDVGNVEVILDVLAHVQPIDMMLHLPPGPSKTPLISRLAPVPPIEIGGKATKNHNQYHLHDL